MNRKHPEKRGAFSGKLGYVLSAAGASVGLGNIWRFPYLAAKYGGGIFLLVYIVLALTFGYTMIVAESALGRMTQKSPVGAFRFFGKKKWISFGGWINAVIPYYGYARQDRKAKARDPITAKLVANLLVAAGADRVLTMDLHASQIQGYFDIPVDHLVGMPILAKYFKEKNLENVCIVSPDHGSVTRARNMAEYFNCPIAIVDKRRPEPNKSEIMNIIGEVRGKNCIILDDMIDTAGTITNAANVIKEMGAENVYAGATHAVLSGPAFDRIEASAIKELALLNTIPMDKEKKLDKMTVLSVAPLFAEAMTRVYTNGSVSKLFD